MSTIGRFSVVKIAGAESSHPKVELWTASSEVPGLTTTHAILGVTTAESVSGDPVAVMKRGFMRDVARQNGETWATGDLLWAKGDGSVTKVRPDAPVPLVVVGSIFDTVSTTHSVVVDVRILPSLGELSGVSVETPADKDVFIFNNGSGVWEPRQLDHGTDLAGVSDDDHPQYHPLWSWLME